MAGFFDGHNIEDRSTPLIKLEVDVVTLAQFNALFDSFTDLEARVTALEDEMPDLLAHLQEPISTAHSGYIDVQNQIPDSSIPATKCAFTVLTLGVGHNQAAYGDHNHDGVYAPVGDLSNYVTLGTTQTITGQKTFTNVVFVDTQNFSTSDQVINLNQNYTSVGGNFVSGLAIWDPFLAEPGYPTGQYFGVYYDSADNRLKVNVGPTTSGGTFDDTIAYVSDIIAYTTDKPSGQDTLPGAGNFVEHTLAQAYPNFKLNLTIERDDGNITPDIGDYWYSKVPGFESTKFRIFNTGQNNYDRINWQMI
jgi:hypothetical protein